MLCTLRWLPGRQFPGLQCLRRVLGSALPPVASAVYPSLESDEDSPVFKSRSKKRKASDDAPYSPTGSAGGRAPSTPQDSHGTWALGRRGAVPACPPGPGASGSWMGWGGARVGQPLPSFFSVSSPGGAPRWQPVGGPGPLSTCPPPALLGGIPYPIGPLTDPPQLVRCPWTQEQAGMGGSRGARSAGRPLRPADLLSQSEGWPIGAEAGQACSRGDQSGLHRDRAGGRCSQAVPAGEEGPCPMQKPPVLRAGTGWGDLGILDSGPRVPTVGCAGGNRWPGPLTLTVVVRIVVLGAGDTAPWGLPSSSCPHGAEGAAPLRPFPLPLQLLLVPAHSEERVSDSQVSPSPGPTPSGHLRRLTGPQ